MVEQRDKYTLKNGMVVLGERMEAVESAAFGFMLPAGAARLPKGCCGAANVIEDWIFRGAGDRNNRQLGDAMDSLGLHRASVVNSSHLTIGAAMEAGNLAAGLDLYADVILRAQLKEDQFEPARQLVIDGLAALDDEPRQKVMLKLKEKFYPEPLGRSAAGDVDELKALKADKVRGIVGQYFNPGETVFSVAGKYDFDAVCGQMETLFGSASGKQSPAMQMGRRAGGYTHIHNDGAQVHIGLMTATARPADKDYYNARVAISVLSGGMSARLFTEVREKRGLCYAVGARAHYLKEAAGVACYAGTTPDKAQETVDVIIGEFNRLGDGISDEELNRAKVGLKSALVMQSESSSSRCGATGIDYYMLGRVRGLDEIKERIEQTTVDSVLRYLRANKFEDFTIVTIGPREVKTEFATCD